MERYEYTAELSHTAAAKQYGHVILSILCYLRVLREFFYSRKK